MWLAEVSGASCADDIVSCQPCTVAEWPERLEVLGRNQWADPSVLVVAGQI